MAILSDCNQGVVRHLRAVRYVQALQAPTILRDSFQSMICYGIQPRNIQSKKASASIYQRTDPPVCQFDTSGQCQSFDPFAHLEGVDRSIAYLVVEV